MPVYIYALAEETHETYGHGDAGKELRIVAQGPYGTGKFPPAFSTRQAAKDYLEQRTGPYFGKLHIVELELR